MHPHHEHRQHKVERKRVHEMTKGYASGGAVHADEAADKKLIRRTVKKTALKMDGEHPKHRMDRRARGGRTKSKGKGTNVNVIVAPQHAMGGAPGMAGMPGAPPHPPMAPPAPPPAGAMPPPGAPAMPPGAMPPRPGMIPPQGMPIRAKGGRIQSGTATESYPVPKMKKIMSGHPKFGRDEYAKGGAVKSGPAWEEGLKNGTQVQHDDGKNDGNNIGRGRQVTFWAGGKVEAPKGVAKATKLPGGAGGAKARLAKEHRAERDYAKA